MDKEECKMEQGKIYFIKFSGSTQLVARYKNDDACNHYFYDCLHYWNSFESFRSGERVYCVKHGIEELRPATLPEKHLLIRHELENNCI